MSIPTRATILVLLPLLLLSITPSSVVSASISPPYPIALPGCEDRCGNISIPYPFGIGPNCFHNSSFEIICNITWEPPLASLATLSWHERDDQTLNIIKPVQILSIDLGTSSPTVIVTGSYIGFASENVNANLIPLNELNMTGSPYVLMATRNSLVVDGGGASVVLRNTHTNDTVAGCSSVCTNITSGLPSGYKSCYGIGCCQTTIPISLDHFYIEYLTTVLKGQVFSDFINAVVLDNTYPQNDICFGWFFSGRSSYCFAVDGSISANGFTRILQFTV